MPDPMIQRRFRLFTWLSTIGGLLLSWRVGFRPFLPLWFHQFLSPDLLLNHFGESIVYLHAQPPLLNFLLGLSLKACAATGLPVIVFTWGLHVLMGAVMVWGYARLVTKFLGWGARAWICMGLLVLNPVFYTTIDQFFYTLHEGFYLTLAAVFLVAYFERRRALDFGLVILCLLALTYTRALFHFVFVGAILGAIALLPSPAGARRAGPVLKTRLALWAMAVIVLLAWPIKNFIQFGVFGTSSWQGFNVSTSLVWKPDSLVPDMQGLYKAEDWGGTPVRWTSEAVETGIKPEAGLLRVSYWIGHPDLSESRPVEVTLHVEGGPAVRQTYTKGGYYSVSLPAPRAGGPPLRLQLQVSRAWLAPEGRALGVGLYPPQWLDAAGKLRPASPAALEDLFHEVPPRLRHVRALTLASNPGGEMNWNHYFVIRDARRRQALALQTLRKSPGVIFGKMLDNYWFATRFTGRHPYSGEFDLPREKKTIPARLWLKAYEIVVNQDLRGFQRLKAEALTEQGGLGLWAAGFVWLLPVYLLLIAVRIIRVYRRNPPLALTATFMLLCVVWVLMMILCVDGVEGNRMRTSTEPFLIILVFWALPWRGRWRGRSERALPLP